MASPLNFLLTPLGSKSHQSALQWTRCIYHQCANTAIQIFLLSALLSFYIVHTAASAIDVKTVLHLRGPAHSCFRPYGTLSKQRNTTGSNQCLRG